MSGLHGSVAVACQVQTPANCEMGTSVVCFLSFAFHLLLLCSLGLPMPDHDVSLVQRYVSDHAPGLTCLGKLHNVFYASTALKSAVITTLHMFAE